MKKIKFRLHVFKVLGKRVRLVSYQVLMMGCTV
jgi:hypothetical protein